MTKSYNFNNLVVFYNDSSREFYLKNLYPKYVNCTLISKNNHDLIVRATAFQKKFATKQLIFNKNAMNFWKPGKFSQFMVMDKLIQSNFFVDLIHLAKFIEFWFDSSYNFWRNNEDHNNAVSANNNLDLLELIR